MATKRQVENSSSPEAIPSNPTSEQKPTVLIFDSGVGGLSVYQQVRALLPDLNYLYAFDNAAYPYGEKSIETIIERVVTTVDAVSQKQPLSLVIIACNTASTVSLPALREKFSFPIVGVVPAIKPAAEQTRNGVIGLLATRATVKRSYTHELIAQFADQCDTLLLGSADLVDYAERKLHGGEVTKAEIDAVLEPWLSAQVIPDTVVLGCTHFPLLAEELARSLPQGTLLVDSGAAVARRTAVLLQSNDIVASLPQGNTAYCTKEAANARALEPMLKEQGFNQLVVL